MKDSLDINYGLMADAAKKLDDEYGFMSTSIKNITNVVDSIPDFWNADTATKYIEQYDALKPSLLEAVQLVDDMSRQMTKISSNFQEADSGMAGQM